MDFQRLLTILAVLIVPSLVEASPVNAKLDPRLRLAVAALRSDAPIRTETLVERGLPVRRDRRLDVFVVGEAGRSELEAAGARVRTFLPGVATASIAVEDLERVAALGAVRVLESSIPLEPELEMSVPAMGASYLRGLPPGFGGWDGAGVLVGTVDTGLLLTHPDFLDESGLTRVVGLWDQTSAEGVPPPAYGYGSLCSPAQIDGGTCPQIDTNGHGTHVAGILAGDGSAGGTPDLYAGVAPGADLAIVKTDLSTTGVVDGVSWLFELAAARGQPAVVNLSLGSHAGPHDGRSAIDIALNALTGPGRIVVKSAGNDRNQPYHAEFSTHSSARLDMRSRGEVLSGIIVEGYVSNSQPLDLYIQPSNGGPWFIPSGSTLGDPGPYPEGWLYVENGYSVTPNGDRRIYFEIVDAYGYTDGPFIFSFQNPGNPGAPPLEVDLWRTWATGLIYGRFSQGNQPLEELVTEPGNGDSIITVGSWASRRSWIACNGVESQFFSTEIGELASFSSPGPTRDGRLKPDITAPGNAVISASLGFPYCAAPPSASQYVIDDFFAHEARWGTSMAAPHAAGGIALLLQKWPTLTPSGVKAYLAEHAVHDGPTGVTPNPDWGHGKLWIEDLGGSVSVPPPGGSSPILAIAPNPARTRVRIECVAPRRQEVEIDVIDIQGRTVAELARGAFEAGRHEIDWQGESGPGRLAPGLYFVRYRAAGTTSIARIAIVR